MDRLPLGTGGWAVAWWLASGAALLLLVGVVTVPRLRLWLVRGLDGLGVGLVGAGVVLGTALAAAGSRSLALFLFGVSPAHVPTFALVALSLMVSGATATLVPARRATRVNPVQALREQ